VLFRAHCCSFAASQFAEPSRHGICAAGPPPLFPRPNTPPRTIPGLQERKLQARLLAQREGAAPAADVAPAGGAEGEEEDSPFAAISATLGWDCFHWVTMLWILLRWVHAVLLPCIVGWSRCGSCSGECVLHCCCALWACHAVDPARVSACCIVAVHCGLVMLWILLRCVCRASLLCCIGSCGIDLLDISVRCFLSHLPAYLLPACLPCLPCVPACSGMEGGGKQKDHLDKKWDLQVGG
jgi:hypothetical protein